MTAPGCDRLPTAPVSGFGSPDADLDRLLVILPPRIRAALAGAMDVGMDVVELALDLGRPPIARCASGHAVIDSASFSRPELEAIIGQVGTFRRNNRAGIDGTLHRLSLIRDRFRTPIGLTIRIGRHLTGVAEGIRDLLLDGAGSLLVIGPPGAGKTTLLRDCARLLSERLGPGVVVVDSHNEIGGDGKVPHPAIGAARRLQVPDGCDQYELMVETVRNHYPGVVLIDEVTTRQEADVARTIARRGVRLIATAHGETLADVVHNPDLCWLVGGVVQTASREGAPYRRAETPTMETALELRWGRTVAVYRRVDRAVDALHECTPCGSDGIRVLTAAVQQQPKPEPEPVRTHELIPESDPWGRVPEGVGAVRPAIGLLYLLGRDVTGSLRIRTASGAIDLDRCAGLPLAELCTAAESDLLAVDPWVTLVDHSKAALALWSFTTSRDATLANLPEDLRPQVIIREGFGDVLVWIPASPLSDEPTDGLPRLAKFLVELALALEAIPAGPDDGILLPRSDEALDVISTTRRTDPLAFWNWVHAAAELKRSASSPSAMTPPGAKMATGPGEARR